MTIGIALADLLLLALLLSGFVFAVTRRR